ncbi:PREDICTED: uncharacterized protein LOC104730376 [Camelina sativa]|uniref:Uncharacterized protein LOC104730376 n=1 Tax=Camelina sativa TaxID=90675 RepID=A0ABM0UXN0_CAMSA|nr:PREDICTED: uncharacterized protein LOC104730376 [Camelina sativa]
MEEWIPLFDIFLNSSSPETEASLWLDQASSSSTSSAAAAPINRSSFVSLLKKQCDHQNSSPATKKVLFIETLPNMVQSKILSFLLSEYQRFRVSDLVSLAREILASKVVDFWVQRDAQNLLDKIPKPKFDWISHLDLASANEDSFREEFDSVPDWLTEKAASTGTILAWLPVSFDDVDDSEMLVVDSWNGEEVSLIRDEIMEEDHREVVGNIDHTMNVVGLQADDHELAANLRAQVTSSQSTIEVLNLCDEIRKLCLEKGVRESFKVLELIEPWNADDETAAVLLSNLHSGIEEDELGWPSQVLCSIVLPKFLSLETSASRVLMSATIEFCKIYQRTAEYALVFPLILRKKGINNFICEMISRVLKECLHLGHTSGFCQKLLCGRTEERRFLFLPCHRDLISEDLTWNESLFILFQNVLLQDVPLTQDSVDCLVSKVQELAARYSKSLKFGNFLLHFIAKCAPMLQAHKYQLVEAVKCTNSLVTKSILSKLNAL